MLVFIICIALQLWCVSHGIHSTWYAVVRPPQTPPPCVFRFVWTSLYTSLAYSICTTPLPHLHRLHLLCGVAWCWVFFVQREICWAVGICVAVCATAACLVFLHQPKRWYLLPLVLWCLFACYLNAEACRLSHCK